MIVLYVLAFLTVLFLLGLFLSYRLFPEETLKAPKPPEKKWYISTIQQRIDGPYYIEGKYWNIVTRGLTPSVVVSFTDKNKMEEIADAFCKTFGYGKVYNTLEPDGKIVYDADHCARYCKSFYTDDF